MTELNYSSGGYIPHDVSRFEFDAVMLDDKVMKR